ncbi:MAG: homoserine O-acetyltransferase [Bacteroidetes bacterium]|nr:homoserine O-acetyltransferase [Bacteroidota bacterium]
MPLLRSKDVLQLEGGGRLPELEIAYHQYGRLSPQGDNVIWVCHALTANSDVASWWLGLFGPGKALDPTRYLIVCANVPGSCYGSTGPLSNHPETGSIYGHDFPRLSIRDLVAAHERLREHLGITRIHLLIGGSLGGQQALEWATTHPERFDHLALIATNARHSAWGIAFNESQRMAIAADQSWATNSPEAGLAGMRAARAIALLSYRNYETYTRYQSEVEGRALPPEGQRDYRAVTYQQYQGQKLAARFNAYSYWRLSEAMDSHDVSRGRGSLAAALQRVRARTLVLGIHEDLLFPPEEQRLLAAHIPNAHLQLINSALGHDGFLVESAALNQNLNAFLPANHLVS